MITATVDKPQLIGMQSGPRKTFVTDMPFESLVELDSWLIFASLRIRNSFRRKDVVFVMGQREGNGTGGKS